MRRTDSLETMNSEKARRPNQGRSASLASGGENLGLACCRLRRRVVLLLIRRRVLFSGFRVGIFHA